MRKKPLRRRHRPTLPPARETPPPPPSRPPPHTTKTPTPVPSSAIAAAQATPPPSEKRHRRHHCPAPTLPKNIPPPPPSRPDPPENGACAPPKATQPCSQHQFNGQSMKSNDKARRPERDAYASHRVGVRGRGNVCGACLLVGGTPHSYAAPSVHDAACLVAAGREDLGLRARAPLQTALVPRVPIPRPVGAVQDQGAHQCALVGLYLRNVPPHPVTVTGRHPALRVVPKLYVHRLRRSRQAHHQHKEQQENGTKASH